MFSVRHTRIQNGAKYSLPGRVLETVGVLKAAFETTTRLTLLVTLGLRTAFKTGVGGCTFLVPEGEAGMSESKDSLKIFKANRASIEVVSLALQVGPSGKND